MAICTCDVKQVGKSSVVRPLYYKVAEARVTVTDWGATGYGSATDAPKLQAAIDEASPGVTLHWPAAGDFTLPPAGLSLARPQAWALDEGAVLRQPVGETAVRIGVPLSPSIASERQETRGLRLRGGAIVSAGTAVAVNAAPGQRTMLGFRIEDALLGGGTAALRFGSEAGRDTMLFAGVEGCTLDGGVQMRNVSDGMRFVANLCVGDRPAFTLDAREGAMNHLFEGGYATNRDGALHVVNGSMWSLHNVQIEYGKQNPVRGDPDSVSVRVEGAAYPSVGGQITRCHLGGGSNVRHSIAIGNAIGTVIDGCYFYPPAGADVSAGAVCRDLTIGTRNQFRGARSRAPIGTVTDATRLMRIDADAVLPGARGVWQPATRVLRVGPGWNVAGLEVMLTESAMVVFNGAVTGGGEGRIATFPDWLRPAAPARIHIGCANGEVRALALGTNGVLSVLGDLPAGDLNFANATFAAVLNVPYDRGP